MGPDNEILEEKERMLTQIDKNAAKILIEPTKDIPQKKRKESLRDFLKNIGSIASLPGHVRKTYSSNSGILHQCIAAFAIFVLSAGAGHPIGFSAVLLPQLYVENSTLQVDLEVGSWIASVHSAASPVGSLIAGPLMERWGRRRTLELSIPPIILGWIALATAPHLSMILIGRLLCGYGVGYIAAASQVYLGEIADPRLRGMLIGAPFVSYSIGVLIVYSLGRLPWRTVAGLSIILPTISGLLLFRMPESPVWLVRHRKLTKAQVALKWLRGEESLANREFHEILTTSAKEREEEALCNETFFDLMKRPAVYKPLIIINIFNLLQILSGTYIVIFYAVDIIRDVSDSSFDSLLAATYTAIIRLIFAIIGCFLLFYVSRRTLSIISGIGSTIASLTLSIFILVRNGEEKTDLDFWMTTICILVYIASNTLGFMMLPSLMVGELLPTKIRGMLGGYIFMVFNILLFSFTKLYPLIKIYCGSQGLFMIFGISSLLGTIFLFLVLPECKNKSLLQIETYFKNSNMLWLSSKKYMTDS